MAFTVTSGWLYRLDSRVRHWCDEPGTSDKFDSSRMVDLIKSAYSKLFLEIMIHDEGSIVVRHDITLVANQQTYTLPPNVGMILKFEKVDSATDATTWELYPDNLVNPYAMGFTIEGNVLRLLRKWNWSSDDTLRLLYIPNDDFEPHAGTLGEDPVTTDADGDVVLLDSTPTDGTLDTRPNAYAGYIFRVLSAGTNNYVQEVPIASYDHETLQATLVRPLSPLPSDTVVYEVVPHLGKLFEFVLSLSVARMIHAIQGNDKRKNLLDAEYREALRALRLQLTKVSRRTAPMFDGRTGGQMDPSWDYIIGQ